MPRGGPPCRQRSNIRCSMSPMRRSRAFAQAVQSRADLRHRPRLFRAVSGRDRPGVARRAGARRDRRLADFGAAGASSWPAISASRSPSPSRRQGRRRAHLRQIRRAGDDGPLRLVAPSHLCAGDAAIPAVGGSWPLCAGVRAVERAVVGSDHRRAARLLPHQRSRRDADRRGDAAPAASRRIRRLRGAGEPLVRPAAG